MLSHSVGANGSPGGVGPKATAPRSDLRNPGQEIAASKGRSGRVVRGEAQYARIEPILDLGLAPADASLADRARLREIVIAAEAMHGRDRDAEDLGDAFDINEDVFGRGSEVFRHGRFSGWAIVEARRGLS